jgi:hypothetical protein
MVLLGELRALSAEAIHEEALESAALPVGEWMFKLHGEVLGPVPSNAIVEHMMAGDIDESTRVSFEEGRWVVLQQLPQWRPFLLQAKAHIRAEQARAEAALAARKRRLRNLINVVIGAIFLVLLSFAVSYLVIVQRPWRNEEALQAWSTRHVPLLAVVGPVGAGRKTPSEQGPVSGAQAYADISIDKILVEDAPDLVAIRPSPGTKRKRKRRVTPAPEKTVDAGVPPAVGQPAEGSQVASLGGLTKQDIINKVYASKNMGRLKACLMSEIKRNEDLPGRVVLNFSIKNDGRIHNVQLDDIRLENGPLQRCFEQKLARLSFPSYTGQVQTVTVPFDWKR